VLLCSQICLNLLPYIRKRYLILCLESSLSIFQLNSLYFLTQMCTGTIYFISFFNVHGSMYLKNIPIYIKQDATLHSLFYLENALNVSGGISTHHQERIQLYLQHLVFVRLLLLPAAITAGSGNSLTNTRCCRYICMRSWCWVEVPPETFRAFSR